MAFLSPSRRLDFQIGIICALPLEAHAVNAIFDDVGDRENNEDDSGESDTGTKASRDQNIYTTGKIGGRDVVLAHMPGMGKANAAAVAAYFKASFKQLKLVLLVGICGGTRKGVDNEEIVLGDVIIGTTVIQYDIGRRHWDEFERKDGPEESLSRPGPEIRAFTNKLKAGKETFEKKTSKALIALLERPGYENASYPGALEDKLYPADYPHKHHHPEDCKAESCFTSDRTCKVSRKTPCETVKCDPERVEPRGRLQRVGKDSPAQKPIIHFGPIASGDEVMRSAQQRNIIAEKEGVIAFDMEAAGAWDYVPCVLVKGVCDYADGHKNKKWQKYAAATAAACTKAILEGWILSETEPDQSASGSFIVSQVSDSQVAVLGPNSKNNQQDKGANYQEANATYIGTNATQHSK